MPRKTTPKMTATEYARKLIHDSIAEQGFALRAEVNRNLAKKGYTDESGAALASDGATAVHPAENLAYRLRKDDIIRIHERGVWVAGANFRAIIENASKPARKPRGSVLAKL